MELLLQDYRAQLILMEQYFGLARLVSISHQVIDTAYSGIERAALGVMDGLHVATLHTAHVQRKKAAGRRRLPARGVFVTLETPWTNYKRPRTPREIQGLTLRGLFATDLVETVHLDHLIVPGHMGG